MDVKCMFFIVLYKIIVNGIESELADRIAYRDGEVDITPSEQKSTDFFFTPFPYLQSSKTECHENSLTNRIELGLHVELYTPELIQAVKDYLYRYQSGVCTNTTSSSSECNVSLLPINSIRLVQKGSHSAKNVHKYTLEDRWQSATLRLQSMEFIMYISNMVTCEQLRRSLIGKCRLPNFELHYSLHGPQLIRKHLEVNTEHVTSTNIYNQIYAQFPSAETVLLSEDDFEELVRQSTDQIRMTLHQQEGFENLQDPGVIHRLLEQHISTEQVHLQLTNDKLWENLYWTSDSTRPDRLATILGSIFRRKSNDSENFIYDRQAAKDAMSSTLIEDHSHLKKRTLYLRDRREHDIDDVDAEKYRRGRSRLTSREIRCLGLFNTLVSTLSRLDSSEVLLASGPRERSGLNRKVIHIVESDLNITNLNATEIDHNTKKQCTMSRQAVEKYLHESFNSIHLVGDIIKPRSINARLLEIGKFSTNTKLFSSAVLVQIRSNVRVLPLRCKPDDNLEKSKVSLADRIDQIEHILSNLNNQTEIIQLSKKIKHVRNRISLVEDKTKKLLANWNHLNRSRPDRINEVIKSIVWPKYSSSLTTTSRLYPNQPTHRYEFLNLIVPVARSYGGRVSFQKSIEDFCQSIDLNKQLCWMILDK